MKIIALIFILFSCSMSSGLANFTLTGKSGNKLNLIGIKSADRDGLVAKTEDNRQINIPWVFISESDYHTPEGLLYEVYKATQSRGQTLLGWGFYSGYGVKPFSASELMPLHGQDYYFVLESINSPSRHQAIAVIYPNTALASNEPLGYPHVLRDPFGSPNARHRSGELLRSTINEKYGLGLSLFRFRFPAFTLEILLNKRDSERLSSDMMRTMLSGSGPAVLYDTVKLSGNPFATSQSALTGFDIRYIHFLEKLEISNESWNRTILIEISDELRTACMRFNNFLLQKTPNAKNLPNAFFIDPRSN
jgi:hypothetical protein